MKIDRMMEIVCGERECHIEGEEVGVVCELFEYIRNAREDCPHEAIRLSMEYVSDFEEMFNKLVEEIIDGKIETNEAYQYLMLDIDVETKNMCEYFVAKDMIGCLKYFHNMGCYLDERACKKASEGHLECLKYLHENGCEWDENACDHASAGHIECLRYLHEKGCPWDKYACMSASEGHMECLKYLHENGCPINVGECMRIAKKYPECLKYLASVSV